ncbi:MAG: DUF1835 domain-containing protein, partial [Saprospiraceae bacterium]
CCRRKLHAAGRTSTYYLCPMKIHILNGDALVEKFPEKEIDGQIIVIREAFVEGPVSMQLDDGFWKKRSEFIYNAYGADQDDYAVQFLNQLRLLDGITEADEIFLWFEDDLFCIVNMLFSVYYISKRGTPKMYRIFPEADNMMWSGFGKADEKVLVETFNNKVPLSREEIELSNQLWEAYVSNDFEKLKALSNSDTDAFRYLPRVIQAHLERNIDDELSGRPYQTLIEILQAGKSNFYEIYDAFWKRDAIYGFGDMQVYNMLKQLEVEFTD